MPEYEHNREERIDAVIREVLSSKEKAIKFMQEAGVVDANGQLAPIYRWRGDYTQIVPIWR